MTARGGGGAPPVAPAPAEQLAGRRGQCQRLIWRAGDLVGVLRYSSHEQRRLEAAGALRDIARALEREAEALLVEIAGDGDSSTLEREVDARCAAGLDVTRATAAVIAERATRRPREPEARDEERCDDCGAALAHITGSGSVLCPVCDADALELEVGTPPAPQPKCPECGRWGYHLVACSHHPGLRPEPDDFNEELHNRRRAGDVRGPDAPSRLHDPADLEAHIARVAAAPVCRKCGGAVLAEFPDCSAGGHHEPLQEV